MNYIADIFFGLLVLTSLAMTFTIIVLLRSNIKGKGARSRTRLKALWYFLAIIASLFSSSSTLNSHANTIVLFAILILEFVDNISHCYWLKKQSEEREENGNKLEVMEEKLKKIEREIESFKGDNILESECGEEFSKKNKHDSTVKSYMIAFFLIIIGFIASSSKKE